MKIDDRARSADADNGADADAVADANDGADAEDIDAKMRTDELTEGRKKEEAILEAILGAIPKRRKEAKKGSHGEQESD